jgi:thiol-disulfide isomerase/thioredoxin
MRRFFLLIALSATGLFVPSLTAQTTADPKAAAQPANKDAPKDAAKRTPLQIQGDLEKAGEELRGVLTSPEVMIDPAQRKAAGPKVIPVIKRMVAALEEIAQVQPDAAAQIAEARLEFLTIQAVFGDPESIEALKKLAAGEGEQAISAKGAVQLLAFWRDPKDEAAQLKVLDEVQKLAKASPKSDSVGQTLAKMAQMGAASKAVTERAEDIIVADLTGPYAQHVAPQVKARRKLTESLGKPIELSATTLDGTTVNTRDWRGKVILVDFWATWCPPCVAALPKVKKMYIDYHAKGLEVLAVSSDENVDELKAFLARDKGMNWPQAFDPKKGADELHPLAKSVGVARLPAMFLIDRQGILRSTDAQTNFETEIPKLIEEK